MKSILLLVCFLFNLFCIAIAQDFISTNTDTLNRFIKFDPTRDAEKDIAAAIAEAKKSNKRILLDVGGEWCGWCKKLDKFFQENKDVFDYLHQNYVLVKVNYSKENKNEKVLSKYPKIKGYPHFFVLNKNGKLIHSQDTGELESGNGYDKEKIFKFLKKWSNKK